MSPQVEVPYGIFLPPLIRLAIATVPAVNTIAITETGSITAVVTVPTAGTLDGFEWYCASFTNVGGNTLWQAFQTVDPATGLGDGTSDQFTRSNPTSGAWRIPGAPMTADGSAGGVKRVVVEGEQVACVLGWMTASQSATVAWGIQSRSGLDHYPSIGTGVIPISAPEILLRYSDSSLRMPVGAWSSTAVTITTLSSTTTPDEVGMLVQTDAVGAKCDGAEVYIDLDGPADIVLYDTDGITSLGQSSVVAVMRNAQTTILPLRVTWAPVALTENATYRLAVRPTSTTTVRVFDYTQPNAATVTATLGGFSHGLLTTRADSGTWTDSTVRRLFGAIRLSHVTF